MRYCFVAFCCLSWSACTATDEQKSDSSTGDIENPEDLPPTEPLLELQSGTKTMMHDNLERSFILHVPDNLPAENIPVVFVLHGYTSSAESIQWYAGMNDIADQNGFVVVYPNGTKDDDGQGFFNVGYAFHPNETVDDVGFIVQILTHLQSNPEIDRQAIFSTGMSNGGEMSYMLACQASEHFQAVASVAGIMFASFANQCQPAAPTSVLEIHGSEDSVNWYAGDPSNEGGWGVYWGIDAGIEFWVNQYSLEQYEMTDLPDVAPNDGSTVEFHRHWSSSTDHEVHLYRIVGGGHDWPGAFGNRDIDSSQIIWEFFSRYQ